ncbi:hypothetical protein Angca_004762 [Angiostrongylus cantonensis]|nr:hypothetical protein Angca_004762 [Angiostrongylus cantonensis]
MGLDDPSIVERISDTSKKVGNVIRQWWSLTTADKRPPTSPKRLVTVEQLPIYPDDDKEPSYKFVMEDPLPLQREISTLRKAYAAEYQRISEQFEIVGKTVEKSKDLLSKAKSYVETEWTVLPKAAAITVGGMAGFVLGLKRQGYIGRTLYTAFGLATMGAFCYPYETVDVVREGIRYWGHAWEQFQNPPQPPQKRRDK